MLSEVELRHINRSLTSDVLEAESKSEHSPQVRYIQHLLQDVLETAGSTHLSPSHGAAAIGALSGLLDQCSLSRDGNITSIAFEQGIWTKVLDVYLYRSQNNKAKPMRRLLLTLAILLNRQPDELLRASRISSTLNKCVEAICEEGDAVFIKPALLLLEHFLSQNIVSVSSIVSNASYRFEDSSLVISEAHRFHDDDHGSLAIIPEAQAFTHKILSWIRYPDCAPAISRLLPLYFQSLKAILASALNAPNSQHGSALPLWVAPVKNFLDKHPVMLETLENHVFPALLRLDKNDTQHFLDTLSLRSIQDGGPSSYADADIQLCLLTARSALKLGLYQGHAGRKL